MFRQVNESEIQQQAVHYRMDDIGCMIDEDFLASRSCQLLAMSSLQNATAQYMLLLFFGFSLASCSFGLEASLQEMLYDERAVLGFREARYL